MTRPGDSTPGNEAPREPTSGLAAALLRISASLDLETVLREVIESARALTGAHSGGIVTIDETGVPQDFVTSGYTDEEHQRMAEWSEGPRLFEHFRDLPVPLRLTDVPAYARARGFSLGPVAGRTAGHTDLPGHADAASRRARRQLLPHQ